MNKLSSLLILALLTSCARPSQNTYTENDVGKNITVEFGRVMQSRKVDIKGNNSGVGALTGATAGAVGGSYVGQGRGSLFGIIGGALLGGLGGAGAEQLLQNHIGIEYTIVFNGPHRIRTIVQNIASDDTKFIEGQCVEVQTSSNYQRVLPTSNGYLCDGEAIIRKNAQAKGKLDWWLEKTEKGNTISE